MTVSLPDLVSRLRFNVDDSGLVRAGAQVTALSRTVEAAGTRSDASLKKVSTAATVAGAGLSAGFALAGRATLGFDRQISAVAAAADANGAALDRLRAAALEAGAATAFSASEAARAEEELAKAGLSVSDILGGALRGSLDLAAAGSLDLGRAAEIAADAMTVFKLSGGDVGHVADVLSAAANKSSTDVEGIGQALAQTGLVAAQFDLSLEQTVGLLALFAQNGLKGSDAGTSLKTALLRLGAPTSVARDTMRQLRIELFDNQDRFIGISAAAQELHDALGPLADEQRKQALATLFGTDAIRAATILYEGGGRAVDEWRAKVDDAGNASETAAKRLDNLAGDLEALGGSIETALIQSGTTANGVLRFLAQGATGAVNAFSGLPAPVQGSVTAIAGVAGPTLLAAGAVGALIPKLAETRRALEGMGSAGAAASRGIGLLGRAGAAAAGVGLLAAASDGLATALLRLTRGGGADMAEMTNALVRFGQSGVLTGEALAVLGTDLEELARHLEVLDEPGPRLRFQVDDAKRDVDAIDKALAKLAATGHQAEAARILDRLAAGLDSDDARQLPRRLNDYRAALADLDTEQRLAGEGADSLAGKVQGLAGAFDEVDQAAADRLEATIAQIEADMASDRAMGSFSDALAEVAAKERALADARRDRTSAGRDAIDVERALNAAEDAQSSMVDRERELADAREGRGPKARELADAERDLARARQDAGAARGLAALAQAQERVADAEERLRRAGRDGGADADVADATEALSRARLNARDAELSVSEARERGAGREKAAEEEALAAREGAVAAAVSSARAAQDLAEQQAAAAGRTLTAAEKYVVFRDRLIEFKDTVAPGSALRASLEGLVDQLAELPTDTRLTVTADTEQASAALGALREQFLRLVADVQAQGPSLFGPIGGGITSARDAFERFNAANPDAQGPSAFGPLGAELEEELRRRRRFGPFRIPSFDHGGIVPGPPNVPTLIVAHGGEQVLSLEDRRRLAEAGGSTTIHNHTTTVVAPGANADVARYIAVDQARQAAQAR